ncbi:MAG: glycoside hydrolase family 127 protein [Planctomycetota bacterium]
MRKYLAAIIINAVVALSLMSIAAGSDVLPNRGLYEVSCERVELRGGFWGPRLKTHHETTIPHALNCLERAGHVTNFDKAAGVFDGPLRGHHAFDSDLHKALEGALYSLQHRDDSRLRRRVEDILDRILAAQQKDGFLISYYIVRDPDKRWENLRLEHQLYNAGHFFEMAVAHNRLSGQNKVLEAAKRFADHIDGIFGPGKRYDVPGHEEIELALVKLYRATGERRYLALSRFFLDERGRAHGFERRPFDPQTMTPEPPNFDDLPPAERNRARRRFRNSIRNGRMQDHKPLLEQNAIGHAVRAGYVYSAMVDIARFMDAPDYERALDRIWHDVVTRKMYITGGIGTAQYGDEGFGDPYLLPNRTYCESCANIAHVLWQHRMNLLKGQAKYADVMELALYNGAISGISISGDGFFYQNPLESRGGRRSSWIGLACCPTNLTRIIPQVGGLAYAQGKNRLYVNLFASGDSLVKMDDGVKVKLTQKTNYPWDGHVKLTVTPEQVSDFDLCLRIPGWALGRPVPSDLYRFADSKVAAVGLKINGKTIDATLEEDGYVHLKRSWKAADVVELDMPMPIHRIYAHEKVLADQGKVSLMRGPIIYCLEAVDHPDVDILRLALPRKANLKAEHQPAMLGGVTVLQGKALADGQRPVTLTAIPYYAWANREKGAMKVWINEAPVASAALLAASGPAHTRQADQNNLLKQAGKSPLKVFILAGQSNMEGVCHVSTIDFLGEDKKHGHLLKKFKPEGKTLVIRDDVWVANRGHYGKLAPGYGARRGDALGSNIGPEYAFGYFIGEEIEEQVLLIKYAPGGRSLYTNFRPPSAGVPQGADPEKFGEDYRGLVAYVHNTLNNLKKRFPAYDDSPGYEIAGFVWFQGYNAMFGENSRKEYG